MSHDSDQELHQRAVTLDRLARDEDLGAGDITGALIEEPGPGEFHLVARARGVLAGRAIAADVLGVYGSEIELQWSAAATDGARVDERSEPLAVLRGPRGTILAAERVLLNFLQHLSGVATLTRAFVDAVDGTGAEILDTRKTTPGWRLLEKYAVRCGGGRNHRMGLHDAILIKDNHLAGVPTERLAGHVFTMLNALHSTPPPPEPRALARADDAPTEAQLTPPTPAFIEVEADTGEQVGELLKVTGIDMILLDNFAPADLRRAVQQRDELNLRGKVALEASGGVTLDTVRAIAETGVDRISVGAITHSAPALDLALERVR